MPLYETHEERLQRRARQREEAIRIFKEDFPTNYIIFHSIFMVLFNIVLIAIQIVLIVNNAYLGSVANGIWCAVINFIAVLTALVLLKSRSLPAAIVAWVAHLISYIITLCGSLVFMIPLTQVNKRTDVYMGWDIAGLVFGLLVSIMGIWFFIFLPCRVLCKIRTY